MASILAQAGSPARAFAGIYDHHRRRTGTRASDDLLMARSTKKARRLVAGSEIFLWSLRHEHRSEQGRYLDCCEVLTIRRHGARGRLRILFQEGPGRLAPDGFAHSGAVSTAEDSWLNLHEPGTVRALLAAATAGGWQPDNPSTQQLDGWSLFDTAAPRSDRCRHQAAQRERRPPTSLTAPA
jgi:hypothetical protein